MHRSQACRPSSFGSSPFGCFPQVLCPCKNSASMKTQSSRVKVGWRLITRIMKVKLNVRININGQGKVFTVWPRSHEYLPGIEFYTGQGVSTRDAVEDLFLNLPDRFCVEDGISVETVSLEHELCRPFEVVRSDSIRAFVLC